MSKVLNDIIGERFGRLVAIERKSVIDKANKTRSFWLCKCDCGNEKWIMRESLIKGVSKSCGCIVATKRRLSKGRIAKILDGMKRRCYNIEDKRYSNYGGRGIKICEEWFDEEVGLFTFYEWANANGYDDKLTIERIDVNLDYSPDNCKWATMKEQANNKTNTVYITINEESRTASEWSCITGLTYELIYSRFIRGVSADKILLPKQIQNKRIN